MSRSRVFTALALLVVMGLRAPLASAEVEKDSFVLFPYVFYSPETSLAGGLILMATGSSDPQDANQHENVTRGGGFATLNGQAEGFVSGEYFLPDNRMRLALDSYAARYPNKFFGIGPDARSEEDYVPFECAADGTAGFLVVPGLYLGPRLRWFSSWMQEREAGGALANASVPGADGAGILAPGFRLTYEGRDSSVAPSSGFFAELCGSWSFPTFGGGSSYPSMIIDARAYLAPFAGRKIVLAGQFYGAVAGGTPPFQELPRLGGDKLLRGYYDGRYRDNALVALQAEARIPVWRRFGVAIFAAAGQVAHDPLAFDLRAFKLAAGVGLRFVLDKESGAGLRADVAMGESGADFYFNLGEAF